MFSTKNKISMERLASSEEDALVLGPKKNRLREFFNREPCLARGIVIIVFLIVFVIVLSVTSYVEGTNASLMGASKRYYTCDEGEFGCCEIYFKCTDKHTYLDFKDITLDSYRIIPRDRIHSNCPSLMYLIQEYNEHYGVKDDDCGEYGCCENNYDIGCDKTIRETFKMGNNVNTISALRNNSKIMEVKMKKENQEGTNCMNHYSRLYDMIHSYDYLYPDRSDEIDIFPIIFIIIIFWCIAMEC